MQRLLRSFLSSLNQTAKPNNRLHPSTQPFSLFKPSVSTLTHQQPYKPHTPGYLLLQRSEIKKDFPHHTITTETLTEGSILLGRTTNYDVIYGSIPACKQHYSAKENTSDQVKFAVNTSTDCNVLHLPGGEKRYYIHPAVLDMVSAMAAHPTLL